MPLTTPVFESHDTTRPLLPFGTANGSWSDGAMSLSRLHHCPTGPCHSRTVSDFDARPTPTDVATSPPTAAASMYTRLYDPAGSGSVCPDGTSTFFAPGALDPNVNGT